MKRFTNEVVNVEGLDQPIINALIARFEADGYEFQFPEETDYLGVYDGMLGCWESSSKQELITPEECLFRGAPEWAVDVRVICKESAEKHYWTDASGKFEWFDGSPNPKTYNPGKIIFARRKSEQSKQWDGEGFPPVGEIVEFYHDFSNDEKTKHYENEWVGPAKVFHVTGGGVCFVEYNHGGFDHSDDPNHFRPIQTDREKCISEAVGHLKKHGFDVDASEADYFYCLYDAGMLRTKE